MKKLIAAIVCAAALCGSAAQYSKLQIITAAKALGKWDALKSWIAAVGVADEFQNCSYLSDEYPQYAALTNALVVGGVMTVGEVQYILDNSRDSAVPDAMIRRVMSNDCLTASGRTRWHGKIVSSVIDTNALVHVQTHADGWVYVETFGTASPLPIERQLAAAERKRRREEAAAERAAERERQRLERIALLTTNMTAEVAALMAAKEHPEELARLMLQVELNKLIGTNIVNAIVTP